ncbi:MAG: PAS-domain containing protein [Zoogloeaceae bacterium]|nr:PAS-domain containing protein [Zoogloeaceae bacterium]
MAVAPPAPRPEALRRYDLLLAGLDLLDQGVAVFDATPELVTWNKAFTRLLDFPESMVRVGTPFEDFVRYNAQRGEYGEGEVDRLVAERMRAVRAFQPHYTERARPNGQVLAIRGVPIPNLGFVSLWTDVTEQRRNERLIQEHNAVLEARVRERTSALTRANQEIDQIAEALRLSEGRLRLIMDAIPALIAHVDAGHHYLYANRGYAEWFGLTPEAICGLTIEQVFGAEAYSIIRPYLDLAAAGEQVSYEYSRQGPEGRTVHARSVVVPEVSLEGGVQGFFVLSIDITEQKASQAALIQAQKMEAVGQLTGGLAHDFNNLLTIIIGNLSTLKDKLPGGNMAGPYITPALQAAQRGAELIRRLLTFSRRQSLDPTAVEVTGLILNMTQLLSHSLSESIDIQTQLPDPPLYALADPHQLENALLNLAINARDAMPQGGRLTISASAVKVEGKLANRFELARGDYVLIDVADTGFGIPAALLGRVFEPFFTTKPFGSGSGLGLSMVYGFVRQSGGNARIRSKPGRGTTVSFVLPVADAPLAPPAPRPTAGHTPDAPQLPVLLVEDEPDVRRVIRQQLMDLGYPVIEADNGLEAKGMLEAVPDISILVSDTVMPGGMDGRDLARAARQIRPDLPILLITGYTANATPDAIPVLRKPFDKATLARALRDLLGQHTLEPLAVQETP